MLVSEFRVESILLGYRDFEKKLQAKIAMAITDPVILPTERDAGWLPEYMIPKIIDVLVRNVLSGEAPETATSIEMVAYLMCASFHAPITEDVTRIYFAQAAEAFPNLVETMRSNGIPLGPLDDAERALLDETKRKMSNDKRNHRKKEKWSAMVFLLKLASLELACFELAAAEGRL